MERVMRACGLFMGNIIGRPLLWDQKCTASIMYEFRCSRRIGLLMQFLNTIRRNVYLEKKSKENQRNTSVYRHCYDTKWYTIFVSNNICFSMLMFDSHLFLASDHNLQDIYYFRQANADTNDTQNRNIYSNVMIWLMNFNIIPQRWEGDLIEL